MGLLIELVSDTHASNSSRPVLLTTRANIRVLAKSNSWPSSSVHTIMLHVSDKTNFALTVFHIVLVNLFGTLAIIGVVFKSKKLSQRVASQLPSDIFNASVGASDRLKFARTLLGSIADTLITVGVTGVFVTLLGWIASCYSPDGAFLNIILKDNPCWPFSAKMISCLQKLIFLGT
ncbi:hypothetical protein SprV_0902785200 [Sparganum proliferum]